MEETECPYCGEEISIEYFEYDYDESHEYECHSCGKNFIFIINHSVYIEAYQADCLNDAPHHIKEIKWGKDHTTYDCTKCDKNFSKKELKKPNLKFVIAEKKSYCEED
jgi:transposase-like protein